MRSGAHCRETDRAAARVGHACASCAYPPYGAYPQVSQWCGPPSTSASTTMQSRDRGEHDERPCPEGAAGSGHRPGGAQRVGQEEGADRCGGAGSAEIGPRLVARAQLEERQEQREETGNDHRHHDRPDQDQATESTPARPQPRPNDDHDCGHERQCEKREATRSRGHEGDRAGGDSGDDGCRRRQAACVQREARHAASIGRARMRRRAASTDGRQRPLSGDQAWRIVSAVTPARIAPAPSNCRRPRRSPSTSQPTAAAISANWDAITAGTATPMRFEASM